MRFPCVHAAATTPVQRLGVFLARLTQLCQPSPEGVAGSACTSTFSRHARRSLTLRPAHSRGHQFVTRFPKASDISSPPCLLRLLPAGAICRVGLAPTGKRRLVTAHPQSGHSELADQPCRMDGRRRPGDPGPPTCPERELEIRSGCRGLVPECHVAHGEAFKEPAPWRC